MAVADGAIARVVDGLLSLADAVEVSLSPPVASGW
jgi:hypothetical protein